MPEPHHIFYIKVAANGEGGNAFFISGSGDSSWSQAFTKTIEYHHDCGVGVTGMKVYKFDQSDPSNEGHPFHLSVATDGTHGGGYDLGNSAGVYQCGTPGVDGSTKVKAYEMWSHASFYHDIHPYCPNHSGMGVNSYLQTNQVSGDECVSGDYACAEMGCNLISGLSGQLESLISSTNSALSGDYESYSISSYSYQTGVEYGTYNIPLAHICATGSSSSEASGRLSHLTGLFIGSGRIVRDDLNNFNTTVNIKNIIPNVSSAYSYQGVYSDVGDDVYFSHVTGVSDRRHSVVYQPNITGQKVSATVDVNCPVTNLNIQVDRSPEIWDTTGTATKQTISGDAYTTTLTANCQKVQGGMIPLCERTFEYTTSEGTPLSTPGSSFPNSNLTGCWEGYFGQGDYRMVYKSGAYKTQSNKYIVGTGALNVEKLI